MMPNGLMVKAFVGQYCCYAASSALHAVAGPVHRLFTSHPIGLKGFAGSAPVPDHSMWAECEDFGWSFVKKLYCASSPSSNSTQVLLTPWVQTSHIFQHPKRCRRWKGILSCLPAVKAPTLESDAVRITFWKTSWHCEWQVVFGLQQHWSQM